MSMNIAWMLESFYVKVLHKVWCRYACRSQDHGHTETYVSLLDLNNEDAARSPTPPLKAWSSTGNALLPRVLECWRDLEPAFKPHFVTWAKQSSLLATSWCLRFSGQVTSDHHTQKPTALCKKTLSLNFELWLVIFHRYDETPWSTVTHGKGSWFWHGVPEGESRMEGEAWQKMAGTSRWEITSLTTPRKQELEVSEAVRSQNPSDCFLQ